MILICCSLLWRVLMSLLEILVFWCSINVPLSVLEKRNYDYCKEVKVKHIFFSFFQLMFGSGTTRAAKQTKQLGLWLNSGLVQTRSQEIQAKLKSLLIVCLEIRAKLEHKDVWLDRLVNRGPIRNIV